MTEEHRLVAEVRSGSRDAAARLFELHWENAWQTAYRVTGRRALADDVAQEALLTAFGRLASFRGQSSFATWLFRIVVNGALNALRAESKQAPLDPNRAFADARAESAQQRELLEAVGRLPLERRLPVVLRYWLDCSPPEIAELLGVPLGTVNSRLGRGVAELRLALEVHDVERC